MSYGDAPFVRPFLPANTVAIKAFAAPAEEQAAHMLRDATCGRSSA
jgi:hypothetical protein